MAYFSDFKISIERSWEFTPRVWILTLLGIFLITLALALVWFISKPAEPEVKPTEEPPIVNPEGKFAFKYYPKGENAPDFRDGSNGPMPLFLERNKELILNWESTVKVSVVKVFDLGKIWDLDDHKLIWQIQNYDLLNPPTDSQAINLSTITPPYQLGTIPNGFFVNNKRAQDLQLQKGNRYSIELLGTNQKGLPTLGTYTFTY